MKIQAKDIKLGMTIVIGFLSIIVDSIEMSELKNGTPIFIIGGQTENRAKNNVGKLIVRKYYSTNTIKYLTWVKIK
jgi:hypothetical protein